MFFLKTRSTETTKPLFKNKTDTIFKLISNDMCFGLSLLILRQKLREQR